MNSLTTTASRNQRIVAALIIFMVACIFGSLLRSNQVSAAYEANYGGAVEFGDEFCSRSAVNGTGIGDYLWVTAVDGTRTLALNAGTQNVTVRVHGGGKICSDFVSAGSTFDGKIGGNKVFSGSINYPNPLRGGSYFGGWSNTANPYKDVTMNVSNLLPGRHSVCITLTTYSVPSLGLVDSPSSCTEMTLYIVWNKQGQSYVKTQPKSSPSPSNGSISSQGTVTGKPGDAVYWKHMIYNRNRVAIPGGTIGYKVEGFGSDNRTERTVAGSLPVGGSFTTREYFNDRLSQWVPAMYYITQNEVGTSLCQFISSWRYLPDANGIDWRRSDQACVNIPYNFNLTPTITNIPSTTEPEGKFKVDYSITNSGPTKSYTGTDWQVVQFTLDANSTPTTGGTGNQAPCSFYNNGCSNIKSGSGVLFSPDNIVSITGSTDDVNVGNIATDKQLCFATAVTKYQTNVTGSDQWRYGAARCVKIAKKPKLQVWGGDVRVGGKIQSGVSTVGGRTYGSWGEYGVFSTLTNSMFASGSALTTGNADGAQAGWSTLTFANKPSFGTYGTLPASTLANQFTSLTATPMSASTTSISADDGAYNGVYRPSVDLEISGGTVSGRTVIINATGRNVTIKGDITYRNGLYVSASAIPQFVIIANNIYIEDNVTNVDAWLIASGSIDTCSNVGARGVMPASGGTLSTDTCNKALTVHGPTASNKLILKRTAGADASTRTQSSETFNLRADAYMWSYERALESGQVHTVFSKELPARF